MYALRGRSPIPDLYNAPFWQLHELYKIVMERAEAQAKAEEERKRKEEEEAEAQRREEARKAGKPYRPSPPQNVPIDGNNMPTTPSPNSDLGASADLEDMFEEMM